MIIHNARILTLDSANRVIDSGALRIRPDGAIDWLRSGELNRHDPPHDEQVIDARGRLLMPALINCHTHLYSTLARGLSLSSPPPRNFTGILRKLWWKLDRALSSEDIYYSALVALIDSARSGVATVVDHHSSPGTCALSLDVLAAALRQSGLRGALCYEVSARNGLAAAREAIAENVRFIDKSRSMHDDRLAAAFGLHASFTLPDRVLRECVEANQSLSAPFHIHLAEDRCDVDDSRRRYGKSPARRLFDLGILNQRTIAAHCVHVSASDVALLARCGASVIHNPQSNCNNAVGIAPLARLLRQGVLVGLGSDAYSPRLWEEFLTAGHLLKLRARDPRESGAFTVLLNNREIVKKLFGWNLGRIEPGTSADLMLLDYYPPTALTADNVIGHVTFGIAHATVHSLLVNGNFVLRDHECVTLDEPAICEEARIRAGKLWRRM